MLVVQLVVAVSAASGVSPAQAQGSRAACVEINTAPSAQLERIIHIGPARAREIITLRSKQRFASVTDLVRVDGIAAGRLHDIQAEGLACVENGVESERTTAVATAPNLPVRADNQDGSCIDINSASAEELDRIIQIGPARAQQIILLRQKRKFLSVGELLRVDGIGPARIEQIETQGLACVRQSPN